MTKALTSRDIADRLRGTEALSEKALNLSVFDWRLRIRSNSPALLERLQDYFAHVTDSNTECDAEVIAIDGAAPDLALIFHDWAREPGKTGRKDSYVDLSDGRVIRKVRTGMVFLQSETQRIAAGPCLQNDNQVINFINAQIMNRLQQHGWLICHAAAFVRADSAYAVAGFSGNGKSTLMLQALERADCAYLTNDRLFLQRFGDQTDARGIPKMPRINPGTLLHNKRLCGLLDTEQQQRLREMPDDTLWDLEEKHDVLIARHYGANRVVQQAPLAGLLILNWSRRSNQATRVEPCSIAERPDLLGAVMKSPGPFYQYADGHFFSDKTALDPAPYIDSLAETAVFEATGSINFDKAIQAFVEQTTTN